MAARLKLLQFAQKMFQDNGIYPSQAINWRNSSVLIALIQMLLFSLAFLIVKADNIVDAGTCFYAVSTELFCSTGLLTSLYDIPKILQLIEKYEDFIEQRLKYSNTSTNYSELVGNIEKVSKWYYIVYVKCTPIGIIATTLLITLINYFIYDLGDESYFLSFPVLLPFSLKTPLGYAVAFVGASAAIIATVLSGSPLVCLMFSSCWLIIEFLKDLANDLLWLHPKRMNKIQYRKFHERFCNIIRQFCVIEKFINRINSIYKFIIFGLVLWSLSTICCTLFLLLTLLSQPNPNPIEIATPVILVIWSFVLIFVFCQCGEFVTNQFDDFADGLYRCNWYSFPMGIQRILVIVMLNTQKPPVIHGFANTFCTRDAFKTTVQAGFSYFMMIRRIDD